MRIKFDAPLVLIAATLLACSAMGNPTAEFTPGDDIHSSCALNKLNPAHDHSSNKRYLRSTVALTKSDLTNHFEERAGFQVIHPLDINFATVKLSTVQKARVRLWRMMNKNSDKLFTGLKLHKKSDELFRSKTFRQWVAFIILTHKKELLTAWETIRSTLERHYTEDDVLSSVLASGLEAKDDLMRSIALHVLDSQLEKWKDHRADKVFTQLKLHKKGDGLFSSFVFLVWAKWTKAHNELTTKEMLLILKSFYTEDDMLASILVSGLESNDDHMRLLASELLIDQLKEWKGGKSMEDILTLLKLQDKGVGLFDSPAFLMYINSFKPTETLSTTGLLSALNSIYTKDTAFAEALVSGQDAKNESMKTLADELIHLQLSEWKGNKNRNEVISKLLKITPLKGINPKDPSTYPL